MKNLKIIGARGFGREVFFTAIESYGYKEEFIIGGFLDNLPDDEVSANFYPPVLGSVENYVPEENDLFICALGNVKDKIKYTKMILEKGGHFATLIHNSATKYITSQIGKGCIIMKDVHLSVDVKVEDFSTIMVYSVIGHDVKVGAWSHIGPYVFIGGGAVIEQNAQLHVRSTILSGIKIGEGAVVGAGSVVIRDVKPGITVFGNPAKDIGKFN
ncbi:MAG: acetyltransferase [Balneolaceae bacterium]|nr:MAG: acetyltransferase [Balneolaceae bacterium]